MEGRKRKAIGNVLDARHLNRLPAVRDKFTRFVRSGARRTPSLEQHEPHAQQPASDLTTTTTNNSIKAQSQLQYTPETSGGSTLDIDFRSLAAFRDADERWFGHDTNAAAAASRRGANPAQLDDKSATPIADLFSGPAGSIPKSSATPVVADKPLPAPPPPTVVFQGAPRTSREQPRHAASSDLSGSVLERRRGVRPRPSKELAHDTTVQPIRIKLATTAEPAGSRKPPPLEPTWRSHSRRPSQQDSLSAYEDRFASENVFVPPPILLLSPKSPMQSPLRTGNSVRAHIRRHSQKENLQTDVPGSAGKRQTFPASVVEFGRPALIEIKNSLHSGLKSPLPPAESPLPTPNPLRKQTWLTAPPAKVPTSSTAPAFGARRSNSTRTSAGVNRLAWIKELEEGKHHKPELSRELPMLRKVQGAVSDKLARFESLAGKEAAALAPGGPRTRSNSISSQKSFLTGSGSRPGSWYQGSAIATTARTSMESHRPGSVLQNYDETFREKMQAVAGKYDKQEAEREAKTGEVKVGPLEGPLRLTTSDKPEVSDVSKSAETPERDETKVEQTLDGPQSDDASSKPEASANPEEAKAEQIPDEAPATEVSSNSRPESTNEPKPAETKEEAEQSTPSETSGGAELATAEDAVAESKSAEAREEATPSKLVLPDVAEAPELSEQPAESKPVEVLVSSERVELPEDASTAMEEAKPATAQEDATPTTTDLADLPAAMETEVAHASEAEGAKELAGIDAEPKSAKAQDTTLPDQPEAVESPTSAAEAVHQTEPGKPAETAELPVTAALDDDEAGPLTQPQPAGASETTGESPDPLESAKPAEKAGPVEPVHSVETADQVPTTTENMAVEGVHVPAKVACDESIGPVATAESVVQEEPAKDDAALGEMVAASAGMDADEEVAEVHTAVEAPAPVALATSLDKVTVVEQAAPGEVHTAVEGATPVDRAEPAEKSRLPKKSKKGKKRQQ